MSWGLQGLTVIAGGKPVLANVDLQVEPGDLVAVVGGDGAGKTTVCRALVGLIRARSGVVQVPPRNLIGYQSAGSGTWPDLTVRENLQFVADAHHLPTDEFARRLDLLLAATALGTAADRLAARLSGGMRQKLGVAMALLPHPHLLVLDEPTTGVDPVSRTELWQLISRAAADGAAVVMTTTYLDEAERAGSILALEEGRSLAVGSLEQVRSSVPGRVWAAVIEPDQPHRWRRANTWRMWTADGHQPDGAEPAESDLADLLIAAAFARQPPTAEERG
jgi:ABC-2 type transport system ATP-binding protein